MTDKIEITPELLADLKARAEKADAISKGQTVARCDSKEWAEYIAAAAPDVILALIADYEWLEKDFDAAARSAADESVKAVKLEEEADWLADTLAGICCKTDDYGCGCVCPNTKKLCEQITVNDWREAARKAVEEQDE